MSTPVTQIKERLSIVDVVGSYIKLTKAGSSYKGLCPFHHEKSPSFNVSPSRDAYYCFGCNRGGDIFSFVEEIEGIEFYDALKILAGRAGVELKRDDADSKNRSERERLYELLEEVTKFYERHLLTNAAVKEYLVGRGLTEKTIRDFRIGFAPNEWRLAYEHLKSKGYKDEEIEKAGMIKPLDGKEPYDRFRGRVQFPIFDQNGRVVAFSGRVFGEQVNKDGTPVAKYINSPETILYDKSSIMFGFDRAKRAIREQNFTILVEGQMDLIMSHQAGTQNAVAVSGTALTERHLSLLKRHSDNLVFAFDADDAGLAATARAFKLALAQGMNVRVVSIPDGKDPADFIRAHADSSDASDSRGASGAASPDSSSPWKELIGTSTHIIDFYLTTLANKGYESHKFREEVGDKVLPLIHELQSKIEQAHYIIEIARKLGVREEAVWEDVKRIGRTAKVVSEVRSLDRSGRSEGEVIKVTPKTRRQVAEEEIIGILHWQESLGAGGSGKEGIEPVIDLLVTRTTYHERIGYHNLTPYAPTEDEAKNFALKAEYKYEHSELLAHSIEELLDTIEEEVLREKQAELWKKLSDADAKGDKEASKEFLKAYQEITPRITALEDRKHKREHPHDLDSQKNPTRKS